ncbi:MAG: tRNA pseudouridine(55) synthase TruB [Armatimonadetes bacterium]|nr:tRNA pseudouridine(55) synthase TruB [Armatimonadota bacterium]
MLGILLIDKPKGVSSHDVVNMVRRRFSTKRVGHAGTLDPLGTGLLVIAVGPATRFLQYLSLEPKVYEAEATFGRESSTQDAEGEFGEEKPVPDDLEKALCEVLPDFTGLVEQVPPMYSAVKVKGKALYHYARKGEEIEREKRSVHIDEIILHEAASPNAKLKVSCSGGTYVRTLVHDVGQRLGCGGYLSALVRTECGVFRLADAVPPDQAETSRLIPLELALHPMPVVNLNEHQALAIRQGQRIGVPRPPNSRLCALKHGDAVIGVACVAGNQLQPECVLPSEVDHGAG